MSKGLQWVALSQTNSNKYNKANNKTNKQS